MVYKNSFSWEEAKERLSSDVAHHEEEEEEGNSVLDVFRTVSKIPEAAGKNDAQEGQDNNFSNNSLGVIEETCKRTTGEDDCLGMEWKRFPRCVSL